MAAVEKIPTNELTPDPDPAKTQYDLSKCPPSLEEAEHHVRCTRVGKRKDILDMNEEELHAYLRDVCPCCGMYPPSALIPLFGKPHEYDSVHMIVGLNVRMSMIWAWVMAVCSLLSLYMVIRNILGKQCLTEEEAKDPAKLATNQYLLDNESLCIKDWINIHSYANYGIREDVAGFIIYAIILLVMTAGIKYGMYFSQKHVDEFLQQEHRADDWALYVKKEPKDTAASIKERIEALSDGTDFKVEVAKIIIGIDIADLKQLRSEIKILKEELQLLKLKDGISSSPDRAGEIGDLLEKKHQEQEKLLIEAQNASDDAPASDNAIVIFKTKEMAHRVYQYHSILVYGYVDMMKQAYCPQKPKKYKDIETVVGRCGAPEDIIWKNLGTMVSKHQKLLSGVILMALIFGTPVALVFIKNQQILQKNSTSKEEQTKWQSRLYSFCLSAGLFALTKFAYWILKLIDANWMKPTSRSVMIFKRAILTNGFFFVLGLIITPLTFMYFFEGRRDLWINSGPISDVWYTMFLAATLTPFQNLADFSTLLDWLASLWQRRKFHSNRDSGVPMLQQNLNMILEGSDYDWSKYFADLSILQMVVGFATSILPLTSLVCLIGLLILHLSHVLKLRYFGKQSKLRTSEMLPNFMANCFSGVAIPYGLILLHTSSNPNLDGVWAIFGFVILILFLLDLGLKNKLKKEKLYSPWSRKGYKDVEYTQVQHLLPFCYEREFLPTRDATFAKLEKDVRASPTLSVLQKKALLTRLGIQHNYMKIDHAEGVKKPKAKAGQVANAISKPQTGKAGP